MKKKIDIGWESEIYVDGQKVLEIGQASSDDVINLFFYPGPKARITKSLLHEQDPSSGCTHELIAERKS